MKKYKQSIFIKKQQKTIKKQSKIFDILQKILIIQREVIVFILFELYHWYLLYQILVALKK